MPVTIAPNPKQQFFNAAGQPLSGGKLYTYAPGTTTPKATFSDAAGTVANPNPIILDMRGEAVIYWDGSYSIALQDFLGNQIYTLDNYPNSGVAQIVSKVSSITALRALRMPQGSDAQTIIVDMYATAGDNGGGVFTWNATSTTADDGGLTINPNGNSGAGRWLRQIRGDRINVAWFGAKGDNSTDNTVAMQAAHNTGKLVEYGAGTYKFTTLTGLTAGGIVGQGRSQTLLVSTDTGSSNLITWTSNSSVPLFRDFTLQAPGSANLPTKTGGAGIIIQPTSGELPYAHFDNVTFAYIPIGINFVAASYWTINNCEFLGYNVAGVQVANTNNTDSGDSVIQGSLFNTPGTTGNGITQNSSGGLKVLGNKFLGGLTGYTLAFNGTNNTSDLLLIGNSFENMAGQGVTLTRGSGAYNFANVVITGNQFAVEATGIQTDAAGFLSEVTICGNTFNLSSGAGYGINLAAVADFNISGNTFRGNGGSPAAIIINSNCVNGKIGINTYSSLSATVTNNSATTFVQKDRQTGSASGTTANGYGTALFGSNLITVNFPQAFSVAPSVADIKANVTGATGGVAVSINSASTTGFTCYVIGATNALNVPFEWSADGII